MVWLVPLFPSCVRQSIMEDRHAMTGLISSWQPGGKRRQTDTQIERDRDTETEMVREKKLRETEGERER